MKGVSGGIIRGTIVCKPCFMRILRSSDEEAGTVEHRKEDHIARIPGSLAWHSGMITTARRCVP